MLRNVKGVVFDLDGTLVDTALDFAQMCRDIGWPVGTPLLEQLAKVEDVAEQQRINAIIRRHEMQGAAIARWMPGAEQCVAQLVALNIPVAILTRNMREATQSVIERLNIPITQVLTREDCAAKPDPAGLLLLSQRLKLAVSELIYVGDYLFDIQTAANAGMRSCLYLNGANQQFAADADWCFSHFTQLQHAVTACKE